MIFWTRPRFEWRVRTRLLPLGDRTRIMAIVNVSPGAGAGFAAHSAAWAKVAVAAAVDAVDAGADIVDLVSETGRPATPPDSSEEEQDRLLPVLEGLRHARPSTVVSVGVHYAETARAAAATGAEILSDLSGPGWNGEIAAVVAQTGCGLVLRHTRGRSREWLAQGPMSNDELVPAIFTGLCERLMLAEEAGIDVDQIVADPGTGSCQRGAEEIALLAGLGRLQQIDRPLLLGMQLCAPARNGLAAGRSRTNDSAAGEPQRIATVAGNVAAILAGVHLLRVHDVAAAKEAAGVADAVLEASSRGGSST